MGPHEAPAALVDGQPTNQLPLADRGFQFGDGLFETLAVVDGSPCLWHRHMDRLLRSAEQLDLPTPDSRLFAEEAAELCADHPRAVLKLYWTAGSAPRGYRRPASLSGRRMLQISAWPDPGPVGAWTVRHCRHRLSVNPELAGMKHLNRLDQVLARNEWNSPDIREGLMCDIQGSVTCGVMSNLFVQQSGRLTTPRIVDAGVAGVVRQLLIDVAARLQTPVDIGVLTLDDLANADALYLTNSLIGVVRVAQLDGHVFDPAIDEPPFLREVRDLCHRPDPAFPPC